MDQYKFPCEPVANEESIVKGKQFRFTILNDKVLRYEWAEDGVFEDRASTFAISRNFPKPEFRVEDAENELIITTPSLRLIYNKKRFSPNGLTVTFTSKMTLWGSEWRYGEQTGGNLGGTARTLDGVDGRCDMGTGVLSRDGYSVLDDSDSMLFDQDRGFVAPRRSGDRCDGYLFSHGFDYQGAMESFYAISGRQPIVPRWSLGNWWSRYYTYTQDEYLTLMDKFRASNVPLSVAVIDMDWHWVQEDFVSNTGWTGYTWNKRLFPNHVEFAKALHKRGLKVTLNDHPHAGIAEHEESYKDVAKALGHDTAHGDPIEFDPVSPPFLHAFFNIVHRKLEDEGCDFWWMDWQQGSSSRTPGIDPLWLLNHYQFLDTKMAHPESEPIIFSRYGGPGSHRYPVGFSGDSRATWKSLQFQPEFTATASNIGYGWWSHDIGGHYPGYRDDECSARWVQYGTFSPILRLHSANSRWMSKEPWLYRKDCMTAMEDAMRLRHRLVPYIFSVNAAPSTLSLIHPLYWRYPKRDEAYRYPNEYYFGSSLVVAPVVTPRENKTNLAKTRAWIPDSRHVDIFTGTIYDGDREIDLYRPLDSIPVLAPEGAIIPLDQEPVPANGCANPAALEVIIVVGRDGKFEILEDSRDDPERQSAERTWRSILVEFDQAAGRLTTTSAGKKWAFRFISTHIDPSQIKVLVDGSLISEPCCRVETSSGHRSTVVEVPSGAGATSEITIDVGADPQLGVLDHSVTLNDILLGYQTEFHPKDRIWDIFTSKQSSSLKASRILSLGLEEMYSGPVLELLLADSRT